MAEPKLSTTVGSILIVGLGILWWVNQDNPTSHKKVALPPKVVSAKSEQTEFTDEDFSAQFPKPESTNRNLFIPLLVANVSTASTSAPKDPDNIPAELAGGDGSWAYTGYAVVNGVSMALLENSATHRNAFVKEGETWKNARLKGVSTANIVLVGADGMGRVVLRRREKPPSMSEPTSKPGGIPGLPAVPPGGLPGIQPVNPGGPMQGPIGGMQIRPIVIEAG